MRKKWYVLLVLTLFVVQGALLTAVDNPPKSVVKLIEKAEKSLKSNEFEKALESYNKALELAPEYGPVYLGIAHVQVAQKKMDEAIVNLEKALQFDPESAYVKQYYAKILFNAAREALGQQVVNKANDCFIKLVAIPGIAALEPKLTVESLYQIGNIFASKQVFDKSNEYFQKVLDTPDMATTDPGLVFHVAYKIGINYYSLQKFAESNTFLEKVITTAGAETINPKAYATAHYLVGLNASQLKEYVKSSEFLTKFVALNSVPANANPQLEPLAQFILGSNAMSILDGEVQKIRDDANEKRDKKKDIEELAAKSPQIETHLAKAIELKPDLEPAYMQLGNFYYYLGALPKAISTYKLMIEKFPTSQDLDVYKKFLENMEKPAEVKADAKKKK